MSIKLNALTRWSTLERGKAIHFTKASGVSRRVRIHLNCAAQTVLYIEDDDGPRLLATVPAGLETVEFSHSGTFAVMADEGAGEVHYQTAEAEPVHHVVVDPVVFTKIAQRRHRNPELEEMMYRMQRNMERRLEIQRDEMTEALARLEAERARTADPAPALDGSGASEEPEPQPVESEPGADAGGEDGGK